MIWKFAVILLLQAVSGERVTFGPYNTVDVSDSNTVAVLGNQKQVDLAKSCAALDVETFTDIRFQAQRDDSNHGSTFTYYRLDTNREEVFSFNGGYTDRTVIDYDGKHLTCTGNPRYHQCKRLPFGVSVPAILLSVDMKPRRGRAHRNQWNRNRYSLRGSFYTVVCRLANCPRENGYCVLSNGADQNLGVIKVNGINAKTQVAQDECLKNCRDRIDAKGCEVVWDQGNRGCYIHTNTVSKGNNAPRHSCWVFSRCRKDHIANSIKTSLDKLDGPEDDSSRKNLASRWESAQKSCVENNKCNAEFSNYATQMEQVANGFEAAADITEGISGVISTGKFKRISGSISKLAPFLGAYGAVFNIIGLFGNSPEVERLDQVIGMLNEGFERVEYRFGRIENRIEALENTIKQQHFWTRLRPKLDDLSNVQERVNRSFSVSTPAERAQRLQDLGKDEYDKVLDAMIAIRDTFDGAHGSDPLCKLVTDISDVDRRAVLEVATDLYNRMIKGALNFVLIGKILKRADNKNDEKYMFDLLSKISRTIEACDTNIEKAEWKNEWIKDLDISIGDQRAGQENVLANRIYKDLSEKYYWRDWLVVVYSDMRGSAHHWRHACHIGSTTVNKIHWKGRYNILVSSLSSDAPSRKFNGPAPKGFHSKEYKWYAPNPAGIQGSFEWRTKYISFNAKQIYNNLPDNVKDVKTCTYPLVGCVIQSRSGRFALRAPENRKFYTVVGNKIDNFHVFILG